MKLVLIPLFLLMNFIANAKTTVVAISATPSNLNPFFSTDANSQNINRLVYQSLIDFDREMKPTCDACSFFKEALHEDGKQEVFFKLRSDIEFHDGSKINSDAVAKILKNYQSDEIGSVFKAAFTKIIEFNKIDDLSFKIVFNKFDYDNLPNLTLLRFFKLKQDYTKEFNYKSIVASGPYEYKELNGQIVSLKKRYGKGLENIDFKVVKDETTAALKLMNQEIDISITNMSPRKFNWLRANASDKVSVIASKGSNYVYLNLNHNNALLKKREIRKAMAHLVAKDRFIAHRFKGYAIKADSLFSPSFANYYFKAKEYKYDAKKAEEILVAAGASKNGDYFYIDGKIVQFDLLISTNKNTLEVAKILEDDFKKGGVKINVLPMEWGTFMRRYKGGQFDLVLGQWVGFTGPGILNYIFHSDSIPPNGGNRGRYINKQFESLYEKSLFAKEESERIDLIKQATNSVFEDVAYISLWHPDVSWVVKKCMANVNPYSNGSFLAFYEVENKCQN